MHTLGWSNYPNELSFSHLQNLFEESGETGLYSDRNTIKKANPSRGLLKALYYLLPHNDCFLKEARIIDNSLADTITIQSVMSSKSSTDTYTLHYTFSEEDCSLLKHSCAGYKGKNLCYHASAAIAIALLHLKPNCHFSLEFKKMVKYFQETANNDIQNPVFLKQLILVHDELYFEMLHNTIPVTEDLALVTEEPEYLSGGYLFNIYGLSSSIITTRSPSDFGKAMEGLTEWIISGNHCF